MKGGEDMTKDNDLPLAVVTGGGTGIGRAVGELLAQSGYRVCAIGLDRDDDLPAAIRFAKAAHLLPAAVLVAVEDGPATATGHGLTWLDLTDVGDLWDSSALVEVSAARVPLEVSRAGRLHIYRPIDGGEEHYAVEIGRPDRAQPVLARLHSACFTGDVLGSLKCDCGPQLRAALRQMGEAGSGVLLYLN